MASVQMMPNIHQPVAPPTPTKLYGVYDPAIKMKIELWSKIWKTCRALVKIKLWYRVEKR